MSAFIWLAIILLYQSVKGLYGLFLDVKCNKIIQTRNEVRGNLWASDKEADDIRVLLCNKEDRNRILEEYSDDFRNIYGPKWRGFLRDGLSRHYETKKYWEDRVISVVLSKNGKLLKGFGTPGSMEQMTLEGHASVYENARPCDLDINLMNVVRHNLKDVCPELKVVLFTNNDTYDKKEQAVWEHEAVGVNSISTRSGIRDANDTVINSH